jgi:methyl-accepting chemotaxis protein
MRWSVGAKIAGGYSIAVVILGIIGSICYVSTKKFLEASDQRQHAYLAVECLNRLEAAMINAETGQRGFLLTGRDDYLEPYTAAQSEASQRLNELQNMIEADPHQRGRTEQLRGLVDAKFSELAETIRLRRGSGEGAFKAALDVVLSDRGKKVMDSTRTLAGQIEADEQEFLESRRLETASMGESAESVILYGVPAAVILMAFGGWLIVRNISRPLLNMTEAARRIAQGDLSFNLRQEMRMDEVGVLSASFTKMMENLRRLTRDLTQGVAVLGSAAKEIAASSTQLASSASQTATAVNETTSTVEEVRQTAQLATQKAKYVADAAEKVATISQTGKKSTEQTSQGMARIREQISSVAQSMVRLSEQSLAIGQIIATVDDLAQQSNLLAVNASIEAAKAGEQGKGFAVVAQEVKSLAEQSKQATSQVRGILNEVQKATNGAVMATDQGSKAVDSGVRQSAEAGESIMHVANSVTEASQAAQQIAASSQQQLAGMEQVVTAMETIKQATTQNVDSAKQLATSARNIDDLGQRLTALIAQYKLPNLSAVA